MIWALIITAAVVVVTGLALMFGVPYFRGDTEWHISWLEFIAGLLVVAPLATLGVFAVGKAWVNDDALRYEEFYNGVETEALMWVEECQPGTSGSSASSGHSNCDYEYQTGETYSYTETEYYTECDSDGECESKSRTVTRTGYIYAPYAAREYTYAITDSIGGKHWFPGSYVKDGEGYLGAELSSDFPRGDPAEWTDAWRHLQDGDPRPVTRLFSYDNYILASDDDLLTPYSEDVERYLEEGILPDHTANITTDPLYGFNDSFADKVSLVGVEVADSQAWQDSLMTFNAALGSDLRGDLHLVLIDSSLVDSQVDYLNALKAYWLGDDFGRRAIAKNAIIVVAGVSGGEVEWGIASTGMPFGNEVMLRGIQNFLPGTPLDPAQVIGAPRTVVDPASGDVQVTLSETPGVLERVVLQDFPFKRACMDCADDEGQIGYDHLIVDVEPEPWQWAIMITVVGLLTLIWWFMVGMFELFNWVRWPFGSRKQDDDEDPYSDHSLSYESDDPYERRLNKLLRRALRRRHDRFTKGTDL